MISYGAYGRASCRSRTSQSSPVIKHGLMRTLAATFSRVPNPGTDRSLTAEMVPLCEMLIKCALSGGTTGIISPFVGQEISFRLRGKPDRFDMCARSVTYQHTGITWTRVRRTCALCPFSAEASRLGETSSTAEPCWHCALPPAPYASCTKCRIGNSSRSRTRTENARAGTGVCCGRYKRPR